MNKYSWVCSNVTGRYKAHLNAPLQGKRRDTVHQPIPSKQRCFPPLSFIPKIALLYCNFWSYPKGTISCYRWGYGDCGLTQTCSFFICIPRRVKVNMQIGRNADLSNFWSEFTVETKGKINTSVHLLRLALWPQPNSLCAHPYLRKKTRLLARLVIHGEGGLRLMAGAGAPLCLTETTRPCGLCFTPDIAPSLGLAWGRRKITQRPTSWFSQPDVSILQGLKATL